MNTKHIKKKFLLNSTKVTRKSLWSIPSPKASSFNHKIDLSAFERIRMRREIQYRIAREAHTGANQQDRVQIHRQHEALHRQFPLIRAQQVSQQSALYQ